MSKTTILLITCEPQKNIDVANTIQEISGVKESIPVTGSYDCIVKTEEMSNDDVKNLVLYSIRPLDHVRSILTLHDTQP
ncbi:MAG: Lrp/AsnC ligand binding domain-containing protein [Nitrosopumilus sp.]